MVHWPRGRDYAQLADDLAADGRDDDAALLRRVAATGGLLTEAQARWNTRYATRAETGAERETRRLIDAGLIDFDPDGALPGHRRVAVLARLHQPGSRAAAGPRRRWWPGAACGSWSSDSMTRPRSRAGCTTAGRWPAARSPCRTCPSLPRAVLEEHILARMLCRPGDLPAAMAAAAAHHLHRRRPL